MKLIRKAGGHPFKILAKQLFKLFLSGIVLNLFAKKLFTEKLLVHEYLLKLNIHIYRFFVAALSIVFLHRYGSASPCNISRKPLSATAQEASGLGVCLISIGTHVIFMAKVHVRRMNLFCTCVQKFNVQERFSQNYPNKQIYLVYCEIAPFRGKRYSLLPERPEKKKELP